MMHKDICRTGNITKIPTPNNISPYLQAFKITNKPLRLFLVMNLYMPSHVDDLHLIVVSEDRIQILTKHHSTNKIILAIDYDRDILLRGHTHDGTSQTLNTKDQE
jgi:hypothetical protein